MDLLEFSHMPPLQSDWNVMTVLCEEIVKNAHGTTEEKTIHPTWLMSIASVSTIGVKPVKTGGGDGPTSSPHASCSIAKYSSHSPVAHASRSPALCNLLSGPA